MQTQTHTIEGTLCQRVLIADDNTDAAESLAILCRVWGQEVCTAKNGLLAVSMSVSFQPTIAVLDIEMPGLNGYEVARSLRDTFGRAIVLVALTARNSLKNCQEVDAAGFDHHIIKSGDIEELRGLINEQRH